MPDQNPSVSDLLIELESLLEEIENLLPEEDGGISPSGFGDRVIVQVVHQPNT